MDKLTKAKRIAMRDFLVEMMITNFHYESDSRSMVKELTLDRAIRQGLVAGAYPLYVTPKGIQFLEKHKDLV